MRVVAGMLAVSVGLAQLGLFVLARRRLPAVTALVDTGVEPSVSTWLWAVAWSAPWFAAAVLFAVGSARRAVAVTLTSGVLAAASGLDGLAVLIEAIRAVPGSMADAASASGGAVIWGLAVLAAVFAWLVRPRREWRMQAPGPDGWYITAAVLAWLPAAFTTTQFAPPGAPRAFVESVATGSTGVAAIAAVAGAVAAGLILFVAPRLRPDVAGTVVLAYAIPTSFGSLGELQRVITDDFVIVTPTGVLGLVGLIGVVIAGVRWASRSPDPAQ